MCYLKVLREQASCCLLPAVHDSIPAGLHPAGGRCCEVACYKCCLYNLGYCCMVSAVHNFSICAANTVLLDCILQVGLPGVYM